VIPGFKTVAQVEDNLKAVDAASYSPEEMEKLARFYKEQVASEIRGAY
jgi:aryl-alcohol dehydrogenase-like predicted oxidoreductase